MVFCAGFLHSSHVRRLAARSEFDELCFQFGIELEEEISDVIKEAKENGATAEQIEYASAAGCIIWFSFSLSQVNIW